MLHAYKGRRKDHAIQMLESCGFHARNGLRILEQKSLITLHPNPLGDECVGMHDHLEEMGRNIVRRSHPICLANIAGCGIARKLKKYWLVIW